MIRHIFFFFNDTATTEIYTLSLHDALPIFRDAAFTLYALISIGFDEEAANFMGWLQDRCASDRDGLLQPLYGRSEEHTSELQSRQYLVCRLLLEKKKKKISHTPCHHHSFTS